VQWFTVHKSKKNARKPNRRLLLLRVALYRDFYRYTIADEKRSRGEKRSQSLRAPYIHDCRDDGNRQKNDDQQLDEKMEYVLRNIINIFNVTDGHADNFYNITVVRRRFS